jgi:putative FmdB family regulatory protein
MPIYEYRCAGCGAKTSVLVRSASDAAGPACPRCGGRDLARLISRFAAPRSEEARMERLADPSAWGGLDENDPRSVSEFTRRMGREMGDEFGGDFGEGLEEAAGDGPPGPEGPGDGPDTDEGGASFPGGDSAAGEG